MCSAVLHAAVSAVSCYLLSSSLLSHLLFLSMPTCEPLLMPISAAPWPRQRLSLLAPLLSAAHPSFAQLALVPASPRLTHLTTSTRTACSLNSTSTTTTTKTTLKFLITFHNHSHTHDHSQTLNHNHNHNHKTTNHKPISSSPRPSSRSTSRPATRHPNPRPPRWRR